jgi:hypothetical protein
MSVNPEVVSDSEHHHIDTNEVSYNCESDSSEVLSVGNEPPPTLTEIVDEGTRSSSSGPVSPESPTSSFGIAASSPVRTEFGQDANLPDYLLSTTQHRILKYPQLREPELDYTSAIPHSLAQEIIFPSVERLQRPPMNVLSLLQAATCQVHPMQQLQHTMENSYNNQQRVSGTMLHQHRLSISKILQRESPELRISQEESQLLLGGVTNDMQSVVSNNGNINSSSSCSNNINNNHNNGTQHQASLKFSIDNILKADFGRRITDPISFKKSRPKKFMTRPVDLSKDFLESSSEGSERGSEKGSERGSEISIRNTSPSLLSCSPVSSAMSTAGTPTDSSKLMQWPAWVYCTRYSDRPSSGELNIIDVCYINIM